MKKNIKFSLNSQLFPLEAVYATCYNFINRLYIYLDKRGNNILVSFQPKEGDKINLRAFEGKFRNELLHNALRMKIAESNAKIREYIIGQAIYSSLPGEKTEGNAKRKSYIEDPLGIAIPWEEKTRMQQRKKKKRKK
jgi:His-Xaa-Ser system protein HxsD